MACRACWPAIALICICLWSLPLVAQETAPPPAIEEPASVTQDEVRLLELGKLLMGQNNPAYAPAAATLPIDTRNQAGEQALRTFQAVVKRNPKSVDGWLWSGIALTETLYYTKKDPKGVPVRNEARVTEGVNAFRTAYELAPDEMVCVSYYSDALMNYRKDFAAVRNLWDTFLRVADSDQQRAIALVQAARACLNAAYFGKQQKMPAAQVRQHFLAAEEYVRLAAKLCPKSPGVLEMQQLLQQNRTALYGK